MGNMNVFDLLIKNARIVDGGGTPAYYADLGIEDGKIVALAPVLNLGALQTINAVGLTLTPGFIDSHGHDDMILETAPGCPHKLEQGITTEITGMCGHSAAPFSEKYYAEGVRICATLCANGVNTDLDTHCSFPTYLNSLTGTFGPNIGFHIGHGTVRTAAMGFAHRKPTASEFEIMKEYVREAMECGALGISFGLVYMPGSFCETEEMIELCRIAATYGGDMTIHMRNEGDQLVEAVEETLRVVRETGIRCVISHHKASGGSANWGKTSQTLPLIEKANEEGYTVFLDQYPYTASATGLNSGIPDAFLALPKEELLALMRDPEGRRCICKTMNDGKKPAARFAQTMIGSSGAYPEYSGMMLSEAAKLHGKGEDETLLDVLLSDDLTTAGIYFGMSEDDVKRVLAYPRTMIGTDGLWFPGCLGVHPRAFATFPRVLGHYVREEHVLSFEEAIRRMTGMPAAVYGLKGKGLVREGMDADLCLLDPETIIDAADFKNWNARCPGLRHVFVAGEPVVTDSIHDGRLLGTKILRSCNM